MSQDSLVPRGNPLTEVMELTARDGAVLLLQPYGRRGAGAAILRDWVA
jgi:hypothetical protein